MDFYPFGFTAVIHDEYDPKTHTSTYRRESGMGLAQSYANAMEQLENYYGEDLIAVKHLELFADSTIILLPEHIIHGYANTDMGFKGELYDARGNLLTTMNQEASASEC